MNFYPITISAEKPIDIQFHKVESNGKVRILCQAARHNPTDNYVQDDMVTVFPNGTAFVEKQTIPPGGTYVCQASSIPIPLAPGKYSMTRVHVLSVDGEAIASAFETVEMTI